MLSQKLGLLNGKQLTEANICLAQTLTSNLLTMVRKGELCSAIVTEVDDLERGVHEILVVSQTNCDRDEANFLAEESGKLLNRGQL